MQGPPLPFAISCEPRLCPREQGDHLPRPVEILEAVGSMPGNVRPTWVGGRVLRAHVDRFAMRIVVRSSHGEERAYAVKVYGDDLGSQVWGRCRMLLERDPENRGGLCLPIQYLPRARALVYPWMDGDSLNQITDGRKPELLRQAARQVADLHCIPMFPGPPITSQMIVESTGEQCAVLLGRFPAIASIVEPLMEALREAAARLDPVTPALVHGDLAGGHFLWTGTRLLVIDFDTLCFSDPAYDIGHFLAQLERRGLTGKVNAGDAIQWSSCFRDAYLAAMPEVSPRNVSFYRGVTLVRKISTIYRREPERAAWLAPLIASGARAALKEVAAPGGRASAMTGEAGPIDMQAALETALCEVHGPEARIAAWAEEPLSRHGKHRVVRFDVRTVITEGSPEVVHRWVGKFYRGDEDPRSIAAIVKALAEWEIARRGGPIVPRIVAYHAPRRLMLSEYEAGGSLVSAIAHYDGPVLPAVARALAILHTAPIALPGTTSPAALVDDLRGGTEKLCARFPREAARLRRLVAKQGRGAPPVPPSLSFLHGDLAPAQLLWRDGTVVLVDFDRCTGGDPAFDLGTLLAQLRRVALRKPGKLPHPAAMRAEMVDAYQRCSRPDPGLAGRVAWYELTALLRKIHTLTFDTTRRPDSEVLAKRQAEALHLLQCLDTIENEFDSIRSC